TSQTFTAKQLRTVTATFTAPSGSVYSSNTLSAYSAAKTYDFTLALNRAVDASKIVIARTSGSLAVPTVTTTGSLASHTIRVTVPASTLTTEPTSTFTVTVDGDLVKTFTVKQAKKPSISVATATTVGGASTAVSGTFTASTWDIKSTGFVTSNNTTLSIASSSNTGTFTVNRKASFLQTDADLSATITLVGAYTASLATCTVTQNKVVYSFNPTSLSFTYAAANKNVTVTSSNAGTISSGMTATSSETWCTVSVSGSTVTVSVSANSDIASRSATVYVTYLSSRSQTFTVTQGPATVTIGGVQWAVYNVGDPGSCVSSLPSSLSTTRSASHGKFYQWNRKVAWATTGSVSGWNTATPSGSTWETANNPCPSGFVVPTKAQWDALISATNQTNGGGWSSSDYGYKIFTDKTNSANKLEFPAVGLRSTDSAGTLGNAGTWGYYWSSTQYDSTFAYFMYFNSGGVNANYDYDKPYGFSVRCVRQ
ncbi:MAG: hypothetical protein K2L01_01100, partial [Rikenellaceae bacterium]|nr:hypothetical protein [Rikenellaceae bacterium]